MFEGLFFFFSRSHRKGSSLLDEAPELVERMKGRIDGRQILVGVSFRKRDLRAEVSLGNRIHSMWVLFDSELWT